MSGPLETASAKTTLGPWRKSTSNGGRSVEADDLARRSAIESLLFGLLGVGVLGVVAGLVPPIGICLADYLDNSSLAFKICYLFTVLAPTMVVAVFAIVVPLFCGGTLVKRLMLTSLTLVPGCVATGIGIRLMLASPGEPIAVPVAYGILGLLFGCGTAVLIMQLMTPWTLTHSPFDGKKANPLGLQTLLEFTTLIGIACGLVALPTAEEFCLAIFLMAVVGVVVSIIAVRLLVAFLDEAPERRWVEIGLLVLSGMAVSTTLTCLIVRQEAGWTIGASEIAMIVLPSMYGALMLYLPAALVIGWLSRCGWRCVDRRRATASPT
ncbi:MAG: hypothetical protein AAFX06_33010 [Planctomycetota bacterium]